MPPLAACAKSKMRSAALKLNAQRDLPYPVPRVLAALDGQQPPEGGGSGDVAGGLAEVGVIGQIGESGLQAQRYPLGDLEVLSQTSGDGYDSGIAEAAHAGRGNREGSNVPDRIADVRVTVT